LAGSEAPLGELKLGDAVHPGTRRLPMPGVHLVPGAKLLVTIPESLDRLDLRRFDVQNPPGKVELKDTVVASSPPVAAERGTECAFRVETRVASGKPRFALLAGPEKMTVSPDGQVKWAVPSDWPEAQTAVLLSITDGRGRETFYRFWLLHPGTAPARPPAALHLPPVPEPVSFPAPKFEGRSLEKKFPNAFSDWAIGGAGRYLVLLTIESGNNRLTVLDLSTAEELGRIPLPENANPWNTFFTAGSEKVVVILPAQGVVQRWNLTSLRREAVAPLPAWAIIKNVAMGAASNGPVLVSWSEVERELDRAWFDFLDLDTLQPLHIPRKNLGSRLQHQRDQLQIRASMHGRAFGYWDPRTSPHGLSCIALSEEGAVTEYQHKSPTHVVPGPNGRTVFTSEGIVSSQLKPTPGAEEGFFLPAQGGDYFFRITPPPPRNMIPAEKSRLDVYRWGDREPVLTVADFDAGLGPVKEQDDPLVNRHRDVETYDKRLFAFPEHKLLVSIPHGNDRIVWQRMTEARPRK
jgi:hypothetical protein